MPKLNITQRQLQALHKEQLNYYATMSICRKVKKHILNEHTSGFRIEYTILYGYVKELKYINKGSTVKIKPMNMKRDKKPSFFFFFMKITSLSLKICMYILMLVNKARKFVVNQFYF